MEMALFIAMIRSVERNSKKRGRPKYTCLLPEHAYSGSHGKDCRKLDRLDRGTHVPVGHLLTTFY